MRKGSIVLVPFPFTDLSGQKIRPAIVLFASARGEDCIVAFISSRAHKNKSLYDVPIRMSSANGLKVDSVIKIDKLATLQKKIIIGELGVADLDILQKVDIALKKLLDL
ncbi:MAG: type II toxin-antitoxin system PemK/MazF family toxin [Patescibacteria group bacterium]